jgi:F420-0:gamma-glutamyl ligase
LRTVGTVVRGIRTPIIKENDDLADIVVETLLNAQKNEGFEFKDRDVVAITEAVVGISEGNYVTVDQVTKDIKNKFDNPEELGIVFPILSRNRFSII